MPHKMWKYECGCNGDVVGRGVPTCPTCGQAGLYDGWGLSTPELMGIYTRQYGLIPYGPHRKIADRLFQGVRQICEQCAGSGVCDTKQGEGWEDCRTCIGLGIIFTRSRQEIEEIRRMVLEVFPDAAFTHHHIHADVRFQPPTEKGKSDLGIEVLDFLFDNMGIDEQWSVREERSFTWWGHRLAQRVWVEPAWQEDEFEIFRVHARTDFLRNVPASLDIALRIATLNKFATLNAFVWDPGEWILKPGERLRLHCSAYIHAQNAEWVKRLFLAAVAIQVADAHAKVEKVAQLVGGEPNTSAHPERGPRPEMDEMLNILETYFAPGGQGASPFTESDFDAAMRMEPRIWISPEAEGRTLRALLWDTPAESPTALFFASAEERHPQLGSGAFLRISIPINGDGDEELTRRALLAHMLNRMELGEWGRFHFLGSWCTDHNIQGVAFDTFLPASTNKEGLLEAMCMSMGARALWAAQELDWALECANKAREKLE